MPKKRPAKAQSTKVRLSPEVRAALKVLGRTGGKLAASRMTPEERSTKMRKAVNARWEKYRAEKAKAAGSEPKTKSKTIAKASRKKASGVAGDSGSSSASTPGTE